MPLQDKGMVLKGATPAQIEHHTTCLSLEEEVRGHVGSLGNGPEVSYRQPPRLGPRLPLRKRR